MTFADFSFNMNVVNAIAMLLYIMCLLFIVVKSYELKIPKKYMVLYLAYFVVSIPIIFATHDEVNMAKEGRSSMVFDNYFSKIPAIPFLILWWTLFVCALLFWRRIAKKNSKIMTNNSIQEGLDYMTDGIWFGSPEGSTILVNEKMNEISIASIGSGLLDTKEFKERIENSEVVEGCEIQDDKEYKDRKILKLADGTIWNMCYNELTISGETICEGKAINITEIVHKNKELETRNEHLQKVNQQIKEHSLNMDAAIREKEILSAKIKIHDNIGACLIALRSYLSGKGMDRKTLTEMWKFSIALLKREAVSKKAKDRFLVLEEAADAVGVQMIFSGDKTLLHEVEDVASTAIHECLTNTVKHANGNVLMVNSEKHDNKIVMELTNNGVAPKGEISETGGLKSLRKIVEMRCGEMILDYKPRYILRIIMPIGEKRNYE